MQIRHSKLALNSPASSLFNVHIKYLLFGDSLDEANKSLATLERGSRANMKESKQLSEDTGTENVRLHRRLRHCGWRRRSLRPSAQTGGCRGTASQLALAKMIAQVSMDPSDSGSSLLQVASRHNRLTLP